MSTPDPIQVRALDTSDGAWKREQLERWEAARVVSRGKLYDVLTLPGFVAERGDERVGLLTYHIEGDQCEVVTLHSIVQDIGAGSALMATAQAMAREAGCKRLWLITTNDNLHALRFYQRRGMHIAAVHVNALEESRRIKPEIPLMGMDGIPLRDEIELEILL
jgi:ribosomal protein S18 acetylase RimI-like enzyme